MCLRQQCTAASVPGASRRMWADMRGPRAERPRQKRLDGCKHASVASNLPHVEVRLRRAEEKTAPINRRHRAGQGSPAARRRGGPAYDRQHACWSGDRRRTGSRWGPRRRSMRSCAARRPRTKRRRCSSGCRSGWERFLSGRSSPAWRGPQRSGPRAAHQTRSALAGSGRTQTSRSFV